MEVYRLARRAFARDLSGKGAARYGARWNSKGVAIVYVATNRSLAMAEVAVHLTLATLPDDYQMITLNIPDSLKIQEIDTDILPSDWNVVPPLPVTQMIGDEFIRKSNNCIMRVPSAVTKGDYNLLINPNHPDFSQITIRTVEPFPLDQRIFI